MGSRDEYEQYYNDIVREVFDWDELDDPPGAAFLLFQANCERLKGHHKALRRVIPDDILFKHVMCNQAARAIPGIEDGSKWEELDDMKPYYESGQLNRYKGSSSSGTSTLKEKTAPIEMPQSSGSDGSASPPKSRVKSNNRDKRKRSQLDLDDLDMDSDMEQKLRPAKTPKKTVNMVDFLKKLKIDKLKDLGTVCELTLKERWEGEEPVRSHEHILSYEVYEYPDEPDTKTAMEEALFQSLLKLARKAQKDRKDNLVYSTTSTTAATSRAASITSNESAPRGGFGSMIDKMKNGSTSNFSGIFEDNREDGQIFWEEVLEDLYLKKVLERGDNFDDDWRKLKMTCGGIYHQKFNKTHPKDPIQNKRIYKEEHRDNMKQIANVFVKKFKNIIDEIKAEEGDELLG